MQAVLPPGTILQLMYLKERIKQMTPGTFIEVGSGSGIITRFLLSRGWTGCSYDLDKNTIFKLVLNQKALFPLHLIQKFLSFSEQSLVLYFEAKPTRE